MVYYNIIQGIGINGNTSFGILHRGYPTTGTEIFNNVVVSCDWDAIRIGAEAGADVEAQVRNCICDGVNSDIRVYGSSAVINGSNNILVNDAAPVESFGGTYNALGGDLGNTNPLFVGGGDYHLQARSPARNAGIDVGLIEDYDGISVPQETNPAIGAYEYVA